MNLFNFLFPIKLFVYGTLKKGFYNHYILNGAKFICDDLIYGFDMYSMNVYPAIIRGSGIIKGEVYKINSEILKRCDYLEGYPDFYNRMKVKTKNGHNVWIYFHNEKSNYNLIVEGEWTHERYENRTQLF